MPLYKIGEFARACGVEPAHISVAKGRGQIIYTPDKRIDSEVRENAEFMKIQQGKKGIKAVQPEPTRNSSGKKIKAESKPRVSKKDKEIQETREQMENEFAKGKYDLDLAQKRAALQKTEAETRIKLLQESQMRGENIPTKDVQFVVSQLSSSFLNNYRDFASQLLLEFSHKYRLTDDEKIKMNEKFIRGINDTHDKCFDAVKNKLLSIKRNASKKQNMTDEESE